jgi:TonB-dependent receptor
MAGRRRGITIMTISKCRLLMSAAAVLFYGMDVVSAVAQTSQPVAPPAVSDPSGAAVSEVVVTGARRAQREAIEDKRKSSLIQDSVSQDDIGRLPDTTVVEAARRIPGVSVDLLTDNTRGRTEVQRASIRGFDAKYNLVTIDGDEIASIDSAALSTGAVTRAFNLNLLPASLVNEIQVTKTVTAQFDPQALGGQINLVTRSAFTSKEPLYADFTAFGGLDTSAGQSVNKKSPSDRFSAIISDRFDLPGSRLGLTLSADYQDTFSTSNGVTIGVPGATNNNSAGWTYYGANGIAVNGPSFSPYGAVPTRFQVYSFDDELKHYSVSGKVEFEAGSRFKSSLFGGYYASQSIENRNEDLLVRAPSSQIVGTGAAGTGVPANLTATSGFYSMNDGQIGETYQPIRQNTSILNWKTQYNLTNELKLNLDAAYSEAGGHLYRDMIKYDSNPIYVPSSGAVTSASTPNLAFAYNSSPFVPTISLTNPSNWTNGSQFGGLYWRFIHFDQTDKVFEIHPSLAWNADPGATGFGVRAGVQLTSNQIAYTENYTEYDPKVPYQFTLANDTVNKYVSIPSWGVPLGIVDRLVGDAIYVNNKSSFSTINEATNDNANGFNFLEQTTAGYVEGFFSQGPLKLEAGLRYESTDNKVASQQQVANSVYAPNIAKTRYNSLLPSVVGSYQITSDIIFHAAVTKTLGRPDPSAYGPLAKVGQPSGSNIAITLGNPNIKPRETTNYDASVDYYFDHHNSLFSVQYFHKDLKNEFFNQYSTAPYVYNGVTYTGQFTEVENGATASVDGVELNFEKDRLAFIPRQFGSVGFGANYTRMWTEETIKPLVNNITTPRTLHNLVNQPTYIANASVFYTYDRLQIALSYNAQGKTLYQTGLYDWEDTYVLPRGQLDLTARYQITPRLTALFEGSNLTGEAFRSALGPGQTLIADDYNIGVQIWAGLNFKY